MTRKVFPQIPTRAKGYANIQKKCEFCKVRIFGRTSKKYCEDCVKKINNENSKEYQQSMRDNKKNELGG